MQETNPDGQAETTLQTIHQEQSHESTAATEFETHSGQEEQHIPVPDVIPNIVPPQGRRREEVEVEHLVEVLHQEEVWVKGVQGDLQTNKLLTCWSICS